MNTQQTFTNQINGFIAVLDDEIAEEIYLDDLERELYQTGVKIGERAITADDAKMSYIGSVECINWSCELIAASGQRRIEMGYGFEPNRAKWIRAVYVPQLAKMLRDEYDVECMGW